MKTEIKDILGYLGYGQEQEILHLQEQIENLDVSNTSELQGAINRLTMLVKRTTLEDHKCLGYYYLLLGCIYQEQGDYKNATLNLQKALPELWGSHNNKAVAHWLLSENYSTTKQYVKAQGELQEALKLLPANKRTSSYLAYKQNQPQPSMEERINKRLDALRKRTLFDETPPDPIPPKKEGTTKKNNETKTDEGIITFPFLRILEQTASAGSSGKPDENLSTYSQAGMKTIFFDNKEYTIHPLKRNSKEIKITNGSEWALMKAKGHSMNNISGATAIMDGDYVLFKRQRSAEDNDIVIANYEEPKTQQYFIVVKRYKKEKQILKSETTETGAEYKDIDLRKIKAEIVGVIHAVVKLRV